MSKATDPSKDEFAGKEGGNNTIWDMKDKEGAAGEGGEALAPEQQPGLLEKVTATARETLSKATDFVKKVVP